MQRKVLLSIALAAFTAAASSDSAASDSSVAADPSSASEEPSSSAEPSSAESPSAEPSSATVEPTSAAEPSGSSASEEPSSVTIEPTSVESPSAEPSSVTIEPTSISVPSGSASESTGDLLTSESKSTDDLITSSTSGEPSLSTNDGVSTLNESELESIQGGHNGTQTIIKDKTVTDIIFYCPETTTITITKCDQECKPTVTVCEPGTVTVYGECVVPTDYEECHIGEEATVGPPAPAAPKPTEGGQEQGGKPQRTTELVPPLPTKSLEHPQQSEAGEEKPTNAPAPEQGGQQQGELPKPNQSLEGESRPPAPSVTEGNGAAKGSIYGGAAIAAIVGLLL